MQQVELYRNGNDTATQYPLCDVDWSIVQSTHTDYGGTNAYDFITQTNLAVIRAVGTGNPFGDGLITDPRSADQIVYFSDDTIPGTFGEVLNLTDQPDDFFVSGTGDDASKISLRYYDVTQGATAHPTYYNGRRDFVPGAYYRCDSVSAMFRTVNGYYFGMSFLDGFFPGSAWYHWFIKFFDRYDADSMAGTPNYWVLQPQYNYSISPHIIALLSNIYDIFPRSSDPDDQASPTDITTFFGYSLVTDATYRLDNHPCVCLCMAKQTDGQITNYDIVAIPVEFFGGVSPVGPTPVPVPEPGDFGPESQPDAGGDGTYSDTNTAPDTQAGVNLVGGMSAYGLHLYRISQANYGAVIDALWGTSEISDSLWQRWENYKFNPLQGIIVNHFVPYELTPASLSTAVIQMAGVTLLAAAATADVLTTQYKDYTVGTLSIPEFFGSALDYSPYTVMRLYLPFCGWIDIDPDRVNGGSITVKYRCDVVTGDVCAYVICTDRTGSATSMYTATGNCAVALPITGNDQGTGQIVGGLQHAVLGSVTGAITGNVLGAASSLIGGVSSALTAQHNMQQTGSYSGSVALISDRQCRLQIIRPAQSTPAYGQQLRGRPSDIGCLIGDLIGTGWSSFSAVHGDIPGATAEEQQAIIDMLHDGVIL